MGTFLLILLCIVLAPLFFRFIVMNIFIASQERASGEIGCATLILIAIILAVLITIF